MTEQVIEAAVEDGHSGCRRAVVDGPEGVHLLHRAVDIHHDQRHRTEADALRTTGTTQHQVDDLREDANVHLPPRRRIPSVEYLDQPVTVRGFVRVDTPSN